MNGPAPRSPIWTSSEGITFVNPSASARGKSASGDRRVKTTSLPSTFMEATLASSPAWGQPAVRCRVRLAVTSCGERMRPLTGAASCQRTPSRRDTRSVAVSSHTQDSQRSHSRARLGVCTSGPDAKRSRRLYTMPGP